MIISAYMIHYCTRPDQWPVAFIWKVQIYENKATLVGVLKCVTRCECISMFDVHKCSNQNQPGRSFINFILFWLFYYWKKALICPCRTGQWRFSSTFFVVSVTHNNYNRANKLRSQMQKTWLNSLFHFNTRTVRCNGCNSRHFYIYNMMMDWMLDVRVR